MLAGLEGKALRRELCAHIQEALCAPQSHLPQGQHTPETDTLQGTEQSTTDLKPTNDPPVLAGDK